MTIYLIPFISAFIGWFANWLLIKMLFHPQRPISILGMKIQGIIPNRQKDIAEKLGAAVAADLVNFDVIVAKIKDPSNLSDLGPFVEKHIDEFLHVKLKEKLPVISMFVGESTLNKIKEGLLEEIEVLLPQIIDQFTGKLEGTVNVQAIVTEKVAALSIDKLETGLSNSVGKQLRFVGLMGAAVGFIIGLLQVIIINIH